MKARPSTWLGTALSLSKGRRAAPGSDLARRERLVHHEPAGAHAALEIVPPRAQQEPRAEQQVEAAGGQRVGVEISRPLKDVEPAFDEDAPGGQEPIDGHVDAVRDEARLHERDGVPALPHRQIEGAPRPRAAVHFRHDPRQPLGDEGRELSAPPYSTHACDCTSRSRLSGRDRMSVESSQ